MITRFIAESDDRLGVGHRWGDGGQDDAGKLVCQLCGARAWRSVANGPYEGNKAASAPCTVARGTLRYRAMNAAFDFLPASATDQDKVDLCDLLVDFAEAEGCR